MPSTLNPDTLKALRNAKGITQAGLAELCRPCTAETVGRWERGKAKVSQQRFKDALCTALDVTWDVLCRPYQSGNVTKAPRATDDGRAEILRNLNARISHHAHLAFTLASQRYGVHIADIVELAPLLFMVAAEHSLADRAQNLSAFEDTLGEFGDWQHKLPQFSGVIGVPYEIEEALMGEHKAIERREVFGSDHWQPSDWGSPGNDPFRRYLRELVEAAKLSPGLVEITDFKSFDANYYTLALDALKAITGLTEDNEHERQALSHIAAGFLDFRELNAKRKSLAAGDFQEWLRSWADSFDESCLD